ncbi:MAG: tRNA(Ile)-lysidine synthetase, partial [Deltaproteobacteria bacterium]|nr:tRNA(Ile)-lysidine synthetase [Deltaproteobacteria bacterium]
MPKKLLRKVRDFINTHEMLEPGDRVVVAVSGGPDSVCLLDILHELAPEYEITLIV